MKRLVGEFFKTDFKNTLGERNKTLVAGTLSGREAVNFRYCILEAPPVVELGLIGKLKPVPWLDR